MGQFSWKTSDTNRSIPVGRPFTVYLLLPNDDILEESYYDGYGHFAGEDVYSLVARWNAPERCTGDPEKDRIVGIELACLDEDNAAIGYPIKLVEHPVLYEDALPSVSCPYQGCIDDDDEGLDEEW